MNKRQLTKWREDYTVWESPCLGEGLYLHVHFDEKDDIKRLGGRWNPDPSGKGGFWWMPAHRLKTDVHEGTEMGIETVQDLLNEKKMIVGHYGIIDQKKCIGQINASNNGEEYELQNIDQNVTWTFTFYAKERMCYIKASDGTGVWMDDRAARSQWEAIANSNTCVRNR